MESAPRLCAVAVVVEWLVSVNENLNICYLWCGFSCTVSEFHYIFKACLLPLIIIHVITGTGRS
jgi:hypothetical protein